MANHDLAQIQRVPVMKDGYDLTDRFTRHLTLRYGGHAGEVAAALGIFIKAQALAAISVTGLFFSHSLPGPKEFEGFDAAVLGRPLGEEDLARGGAAHRMVWGRHQTPEVLQGLAKQWWADAFICGHQQQENGFGTFEPNMLIVDSSHNHGTMLHVDLARPYTLGDLQKALIPLAALP